MKYQKEFEEFAKNNPSILGGNSLTTTSNHYGIPLQVPEYDSSHVQFVYQEFCEFMDKALE